MSGPINGAAVSILESKVERQDEAIEELKDSIDKLEHTGHTTNIFLSKLDLTLQNVNAKLDEQKSTNTTLNNTIIQVSKDLLIVDTKFKMILGIAAVLATTLLGVVIKFLLL